MSYIHLEKSISIFFNLHIKKLITKNLFNTSFYFDMGLFVIKKGFKLN